MLVTKVDFLEPSHIMLSALLLGAAKKSESGLDKSLESIFKTSVRFLTIESSENLMTSYRQRLRPLLLDPPVMS